MTTVKLRLLYRTIGQSPDFDRLGGTKREGVPLKVESKFYNFQTVKINMVGININNNYSFTKDDFYPQKYLVVDDEIAKNENDREDFILDIGIPEDLALFASSYDEAMDLVNSHSDIAICYIDCKIPKNSKNLYDFQPSSQENLEWGIRLIPEINQIQKQAQIAVYSAYVTISYLIEKVKQYVNITGCYDKPNGIEYRKELYESAVQKRLVSVQQLPRLDSSQKPAFDYNLLEGEVQVLVKNRTKQIKALLRRSAQDILDIGKYLAEVKAYLNHGQFYPWLEAELQWSPTSVARFMQVYRRLKSVKLTDFTDLEVFPSALYQLTTSNVPDSAIIEMKQLAEAGVSINLDVAKTIKKKHTFQKKKHPNQDREPKAKQDEKQLSRTVQTELQKEAGGIERSKSHSIEKAPTIKQNILKVIPRQNEWRVGNHLIICAEPNSSKFIKLLPNEISLCLCFPPDKHWSFNSDLYKSKMNFYSQYKDLDPVPLLESIEKTILITTNEGDNIAVCYICLPQILMPISKLGCRAYVAEPDYQKCLNLIDYFNR